MQMQAQLNEEISSLRLSLEVERESHNQKLQALHLQTKEQLQQLLQEAHQRQLYSSFATGVAACIFVVLLCLVKSVTCYLCRAFVWSKKELHERAISETSNLEYAKTSQW